MRNNRQSGRSSMRKNINQISQTDKKRQEMVRNLMESQKLIEDNIRKSRTNKQSSHNLDRYNVDKSSHLQSSHLQSSHNLDRSNLDKSNLDKSNLDKSGHLQSSHNLDLSKLSHSLSKEISDIFTQNLGDLSSTLNRQGDTQMERINILESSLDNKIGILSSSSLENRDLITSLGYRLNEIVSNIDKIVDYVQILEGRLSILSQQMTLLIEDDITGDNLDNTSNLDILSENPDSILTEISDSQSGGLTDNQSI